jgi:hypothetical protein
MKDEQGSWGTQTLGPEYRCQDSPRQDVSDNDDPDFTDEPTKKKKYTYRKEVQRSYRQRVKNKHADVKAALEETRRQWDAVAASNRYLQDNEHALELLNTEGADLLNILMNTQSKKALAENITALPAEDLVQVADSLLDVTFNGVGMIPEDQLKFYFESPKALLIKVETGFMDRVDSLMAEVRESTH